MLEKEITYDDIIKTISEISNSVDFYKKDLTLVYKVTPKYHKKLDETLYYKFNPNGDEFKSSDEIELTLDNIVVKILKKDE